MPELAPVISTVRSLMSSAGRGISGSCGGPYDPRALDPLRRPHDPHPPVSDAPARLGVVGAGTMGSGIAQLGCLAGMETFLHDPVPEALAAGAERLREGLRKGAERGRWSDEEADAAAGRFHECPALEELAECELVIEAAPERAELKRDLFARLSEICNEGTVLATNTSSIPVTALASAAAHPENVVGMHFFNPAPLMRLVEVIAAMDTSERALAIAS